MLERFVIPESKLFNKILTYQLKDVIPIIDYAIENSNKTKQFEDNFNRILDCYPYNVHALKLSGLNLSESATSRLVKNARMNNCTLLIDAEDVKIQDRIENITNRIIANPENTHVFKTYQMYRKDAYSTLVKDIETYKTNLNVKLVRGAYMYTDKSSGKLYIKKEDTDFAYDKAIRLLCENHDSVGQVIFATHNKKSFDLVKYTKNPNFYHASLMGFDDKFQTGSIQRMVYIPFGPYYETYPYLIRRFFENPIAFI
jgi:hypothetical protein